MRELLLGLAVMGMSACPSDDGQEAPDVPAAEDSAPDVVADPGPEPGDVADAQELPSDDTAVVETDGGPTEELETPSMSAYLAAPAGSVLPAEVVSCAVIHEHSCQGGTTHSCELYDGIADGWATEVPPMTEQAFVFERFYDLYHSPNGESMDIRFTQPVFAGTPESEWSKPEFFLRYDGYGDSAGWTGTALWGAAARYQVTGTAADYLRMLQALEDMLFFYEVADAPGLLARSHWAMLPEGAPHPRGNWDKAVAGWEIGDGSDGHFSFEIRQQLWDRLPDYYHGEVVIEGTAYPTTPRVQTDASRDMYVRSLPGILLAYDLLGEGDREEAVRATIRNELPCTLARMKKGRIRNLQQNQEILDAVTTYFGGTTLNLDEGDLDFASLDTMIFYVLEQPHPLHLDAFDAACPDGPPTDVDPALDLDAADDFFILHLAELAQREQRQGEVPIAFSQHVTVRASDTLFITQWALTAHYLTGDERYLEFVEQLMDEVPYAGVLYTLGAFELPKYCAPHFAPSLLYPTLYNLLARIDREAYPKFWEMLAGVAFVEGRQKEYGQRDDAFWGILYNRMVDSDIDPERDAYVAANVALLATYGMNPDDKLEPDRSYPRDFVTDPDPSVPLEEIAPGDPEWAICEEPTTVMGIEVPPAKIDGIPVRSVDPLPLDKRIGGTLLWQMDPWMVQRDYGGTGMDRQWPMLGLFTPYWIGRADGVIQEGEGLALGWKDTGEPCGE